MTNKPKIDLPVIIAEWPRNSRETMRVQISRYQDREIFELRAYYTDAEGELKPTKSGITLSLKHLPNAAASLVEALNKVRALGLLQDESGTS